MKAYEQAEIEMQEGTISTSLYHCLVLRIILPATPSFSPGLSAYSLRAATLLMYIWAVFFGASDLDMESRGDTRGGRH